MLGTYEIIDVEVLINGSVEFRQNIVYYDLNGNLYLIERFYGEVRDGFTKK